MSSMMYSNSIPVLVRTLSNMSAILEKAAKYAADKSIDESVLVTARLYPNMFPLARQVQIACDVSKGAGARLSGIEAPKYEDNEATFAELLARISKTITFLKSLPENKINGTEEKQIVIQAGPNEFKFKGQDYLNLWALPNVYFHVTTTYNILRHNGLDIGKMDFLGPQ